MAARRWERWAHSVPVRCAGEAAAATVGRLWAAGMLWVASEPAPVRASGLAGDTGERARRVEAAGGSGDAPRSDLSFTCVLLRFAVGSHVCVSVVCREYVVTMMLSSE